LLGLRLLRIDGVVLLSPGRLEEPMSRASASPAPVVGYELSEAARLLQETEATLRGAENGSHPAMS
jgi:hypothetical protein